MQDTLKELLEKIKKEKASHRRVVAMLVVVALVTSMVTTWTLRLEGHALDKTLACGKEEHVHTEDCMQKVLTCGLSDEAHAHTMACYNYEPVLTCEEPEHTHSDECFDADGNLICEAAEHTHDASCYTQQLVLVCDLPTEPEHVHTDACYTTELVCGKEEHTHDDSCYTDPTADVETAEDWEETLPKDEEITGEWAHDLLAVAESQVDYTESVENWQLSDDGTTHKGYTRYGAWYGTPYEDWCAMFVSFCLNYAGIPEKAVSRNASCPNWVDALKEQELFVAPEADYTPQPGDLMFVDFNTEDEETVAQHVAIVKEFDEEHNVIYAYEGNSNDKVQVMAYLLPGYVEPTEEDQADLPEEERFHTPEICLQMDEGTLVGYLNLAEAEKTYREKYPEEDMTSIADSNFTGTITDTDLTTTEDEATDTAVSAQSILPSYNEQYGNNGKVYIKVLLDGEWQVVGSLDSYQYENGKAYVTTDQLTSILAPFGYTTAGDAGNLFGYAMPDDIYYAFLSSKNNGYALDVDLGENKILNNGNNARLWQFDGDDNQIFKIQDMGNGTSLLTLFAAIKQGTEFNINVNGNSTENTTNIQIWNDRTTASQWIMKQRRNNGSYYFVSVLSANKAIDIDGGIITNGQNIQLYDYNDTEAQEWDLKPTNIIDNRNNEGNKVYLGTNNGSDVFCYYLPDNVVVNRTAEIYTGFGGQGFYTVTIDPNNVTGSKCVQYARNGSNHTAYGMPSGYTWTGIDKYGNSKTVTTADAGNGTVNVTINGVTSPVTLYPSTDASVASHTVTFKVRVNGEWKTVGYQPYYHYNGSRAYITAQEAALFYADYGYNPAQDPGYSFAYSYADDPVYHIFYNDTNNKVFDVKGGQITSGTAIQIYDFNGSLAQTFRLEDAGSGYTGIASAGKDSKNGNTCYVNVSGAGYDNDKKIALYSGAGLNDSSNVWKIVDQGNGKVVIYTKNDPNTQNPEVLIDLPSGNTANETQLHLWKNGTNCYWRLSQTYLMYNDMAAVSVDGSYNILLADRNTGDIICYYIPSNQNKPNQEKDYTAMAPNRWSNIETWNIKVVDENNVRYSDSQLAALEKNVVRGGSTAITVENASGYAWVAVGNDGTAFNGTNSNGKTTFNFTNLSQSYRIVLISTNPSYTVGYYGYVQELDSTPTGNENLAVYDTSGASLPQNANDTGTRTTNKLVYLSLNSDGTVKYNTVETQLYADRTFKYLSAPKFDHTDILSNYGNYEVEKIRVTTGGMVVYEGSPEGVEFVTNPTKAGGSKILITDHTYIKITYRQTSNDTVKIQSRFLDYDFMSQNQQETSNNNHNHGINYFGGMTKNDGNPVSENYCPQYLFGNANAGVRHSADYYNVNGDSNAIPNMTQNNWAQGTDATSQPAYRLNASSNWNWRHCLFGLVKDQLKWNSSTNEYDLQFQDYIAYPRNLFDGVTRADKHILNYSLVFARVGDSYTLRQVAGFGDNGYMQKYGLSGDPADLRQLWNPTSAGGTTYSHIFTNNFWPMDIPAANGWDSYYATQNYKDKFYGVTNVTVNKSSDALPMPGQTQINLPPSDDGHDHNCLFGMTTSIEFSLRADYVGPLNYLFYGDDDLWIYLVRRSGTSLPNGADTQLICDIGGVHSSAGEYVNLRDYLPEGSEGEYGLRIFYTERGNSGSTCYMNFVLPSVGTASTIEDTTSVTLQKQVVGNVDSSRTFDFNFVARDSDGNTLQGEYPYAKVIDGEVIYETGWNIKADGSQTVSLKAGESLMVDGLPTNGSYSATFHETGSTDFQTIPSIPGRSDYTVSNNGKSITFPLDSDGSKNSVIFTNYQTTNISLEKQLDSYGGDNQVFNFKFCVFDPDWNSLTMEFDYEKSDGTTGKVSSVNIGASTYQVSLKGGEKITIKNVPVGWHVEFFEQKLSDYEVSFDTSKCDCYNTENYSIRFNVRSSASDNAAVFKNTRATTSATLEKQVVGNVDSGKTFTFQFRTSWNSSGANFPYVKSLSGSQTGTGTISGGDTLTLQPGEKITISKLPIGDSYKVEFVETLDDEFTTSFNTDRTTNPYDYTETGKSGKGFTLVSDGNNNYLICVNTRKTVNVTVSKTVSEPSGTIGSNAQNQDYRFMIRKRGNTGWGDTEMWLSAIAAGTYISHAGRTVTVETNGTFTLHAGDSVTFTLPYYSNGRQIFVQEWFPIADEGKYTVSCNVNGTQASAIGTLYYPELGGITCSPDKNDGNYNYVVYEVAPYAPLNSNTDISFAATNTVNTGSLQINKEVTAFQGSTTGSQFIMNVKIAGQPLAVGTAYKIGDQAATVTTEGQVIVKVGQTTTINNIAIGSTFEVKEVDTNNSGYVPSYKVDSVAVPESNGSATGTITSSSTPVTVLVHNAQRGTTLSIPVKKVISNPDGIQRTFEFTLWRWDPSEDRSISPVTVTISGNEASNAFQLKYLAEDFDNGTTTYKYRMDETAGTDGNIYYDTGIHYDIFVEITKSDTEFKAEIKQVVLNHDSPAGAAEYPEVPYFTNTLLGNLKITKYGVGTMPDSGFTFEVTLAGQTGRTFQATKTKADGTQEAVTVTTNDQGVATVTIKADESLEIIGIPKGTVWTVKETTTGYDTSYVVNGGSPVNGTVAGGTTTDVIDYAGLDTVVFTNKNLTSATLEKKVDGPNEADRAFDFELWLWKDSNPSNDEFDWAWMSGTFHYTIKDKNDNVVTIDGVRQENISFTPTVSSNPHLTFQLKNGWKITVTDLPVGCRVEFIEVLENNLYAPKFDSNAGIQGVSGRAQGYNNGSVGWWIQTIADSTTNKVVCTNYSSYELPEAGGSGTMPFVIGGLMLMGIPVTYALIPKRKRLKKPEESRG